VQQVIQREPCRYPATPIGEPRGSPNWFRLLCDFHCAWRLFRSLCRILLEANSCFTFEPIATASTLRLRRAPDLLLRSDARTVTSTKKRESVPHPHGAGW